MVALVRALVEDFLPNSPVSHRTEKNARSGRRPLDNAATLDVGVTQSKLHEPAIRNSNDLEKRKLASHFMLLNAQINRIRHWFYNIKTILLPIKAFNNSFFSCFSRTLFFLMKIQS